MVDLVLIMSVNPGFGGQSFIESQVKKISDLRRMCAEKVISTLIFGLSLNARITLDRKISYCLFAGSESLD